MCRCFSMFCRTHFSYFSVFAALVACSLHFVVIDAVCKDIFYFSVSPPPLTGGPEGGSGLPFSAEAGVWGRIRGVIFILILYFDPKYIWVIDAGSLMLPCGGVASGHLKYIWAIDAGVRRSGCPK
jgi:hypothetical protein